MSNVKQYAYAAAITLAGIVPAFGQTGTDQSEDAASGPRPVPINSSWVVRKADSFKDKRIYRRYSFTQDMDLPNVMMLVCPRKKDVYVHVSFEMKRVGDIKAIFPSGFDDVEARFLVDRASFSLHGEVIGTELFFDRTPGSWEDFDKIIGAETFTMRFGNGGANATVIFKVIPEFTKALPDILQTVKAGPVTYFTTEQALRDCRRYRGEV